jgi:hypothetical protein
MAGQLRVCGQSIKASIHCRLFYLLFCFIFPYSRFGHISRECDGRILSCDARIMRTRERARFYLVSLTVGAGGEHEGTRTMKRTSSNRITIKGSCQQGCSVKRRGVGSGEPGKARKNGSEMIDCPAAMPNRATSTHGPPQKGVPEGGYRPAPSGFGGSPPPLRSEGGPSDPLNIHSNPGPGPFRDPRQSFFVPLWFLRSSCQVPGPLPCRTVALNVRQCP